MDGARDPRPKTKGSFPGRHSLVPGLHGAALTTIDGALSEDLHAAAPTFARG